jgi:hypothetical protein
MLRVALPDQSTAQFSFRGQPRAHVVHTEHIHDAEASVCIWFNDASKHFYTTTTTTKGTPPQLTRVVYFDGYTRFFKGASGRERLVRDEMWKDGIHWMIFFRGGHGYEDAVSHRPRRSPAYLWALMRRQARHIALAWFWFGLAGAPGGKAHAKAVGEWADMQLDSGACV